MWNNLPLKSISHQVELYLVDLVVEEVAVVLMTTTINQKELPLEVEVVEVQDYQ